MRVFYSDPLLFLPRFFARFLTRFFFPSPPAPGTRQAIIENVVEGFFWFLFAPPIERTWFIIAFRARAIAHPKVRKRGTGFGIFFSKDTGTSQHRMARHDQSRLACVGWRSSDLPTAIAIAAPRSVVAKRHLCWNGK